MADQARPIRTTLWLAEVELEEMKMKVSREEIYGIVEERSYMDEGVDQGNQGTDAVQMSQENVAPPLRRQVNDGHEIHFKDTEGLTER